MQTLKEEEKCFFTFLNCHQCHIMQQRLLKSTDFTSRPKNLFVKITMILPFFYKTIFTLLKFGFESQVKVIILNSGLLSKNTSMTFNILAFIYVLLQKKILTKSNTWAREVFEIWLIWYGMTQITVVLKPLWYIEMLLRYKLFPQKFIG